jgi:hypothetical protein
MPMYMYQASYTPESLAAQIKEPKDRIEVVKPVFDAIGAKILAAGYPFFYEQHQGCRRAGTGTFTLGGHSEPAVCNSPHGQL